MGTNTCLLLIVDWDEAESRIREIVLDRSRVVRLGQGVDKSRVLHPDAKDRTLACLREYAQELQSKGIPLLQVTCVATSQARDAKDGAAFFDTVFDQTGLKFEVLTGQDEAIASFLGAMLPGMDRKKTAVIDIGGGSTELMSEKGGLSVDMGSVRFTERYFHSDPVTDEAFWKCQKEVDQELEALKSWRRFLDEGTELLAVAGTATTLASWFLGLKAFNREAIDGCILTAGDVHRMVEELKWRTIAERQYLPGVEHDRAEVLLAGAMILWRSMEVLGFSQCRISTRGLRYGIISR